MSKKNPIICCILDGLGIGKGSESFYAPYRTRFPNTILNASGEAVGLLSGMVGNSMAGHLTLGSGRIIPQPITLFTHALRTGSIPNGEYLCSQAAAGNALHISALLSPSGVHGSLEILYKTLTLLQQSISHTIFIHAILDGRDAPPFAGYSYLEELATYCEQHPQCILASVSGRFYALDRDNHLERTADYCAMLTNKNITQNWRDVVQEAYAQKISDEYVAPFRTADFVLEPHDCILILITRADRARSLVRTLQQTGYTNLITATDYGLEDQPPFLVPAPHAEHTLCETISAAGYRIFSIAESEKKAHVTYFFNGGREIVYPHETRVIIPSDPLRSFAEKPAMHAAQITDAVIDAYDSHDFFVINYANPDMVGHTGSIPATEEALAITKSEVDRLIQHVQQNGGTLIITADHGNAEAIYDTAGSIPHTMHTTAPVPMIVVGKSRQPITGTLQGLADVAPWILREAAIPVPAEMVGSRDILIMEDTYE